MEIKEIIETLNAYKERVNCGGVDGEAFDEAVRLLKAMDEAGETLPKQRTCKCLIIGCAKCDKDFVHNEAVKQCQPILAKAIYSKNEALKWYEEVCKENVVLQKRFKAIREKSNKNRT